MQLAFTLTSSSWFILALWIILLVLGHLFKNKIISTGAGLIGVLFAIDLISGSTLIGVAILAINLYILFSVMWEGE